MAELTVHGAEGAYPVVIAPGALAEALPAFVAARGFTRVAVITNTTLAPLYGAALAARLPGGHLITVPDGEQYKTLDTLRAIYDGLLAAGADRATLVVGLGGGVIGDMAGFAAATFMRGVRVRPGSDQPAGDGRCQRRRQGRRRSAPGQEPGRRVQRPAGRVCGHGGAGHPAGDRMALRHGRGAQGGADRRSAAAGRTCHPVRPTRWTR